MYLFKIICSLVVSGLLILLWGVRVGQSRGVKIKSPSRIEPELIITVTNNKADTTFVYKIKE